MAALALGCVSSAFAGSNNFVFSTDKLGYTGTVSRFNSLSDAQNDINSVGVFNLQQRDFSTYFVNNRPDFDTNYTFLLTAWYYTTSDNTNGKPKGDPTGDRYYSGWGNPSNTDNSFFQIGDTGSVTVDNTSGNWTSSAYDTFKVHVDGHNATYANSYARLWNAGDPDVGGEGTQGTFYSYSLDATATGLNGVYSGGGNVTATNQPSHITGSATAIFKNLSTTSPVSNGWYRAELTFNDTNWAYANQSDLNGPFNASTFSAGVVPEPTTMAVLGVGALALLRKRSKRS